MTEIPYDPNAHCQSCGQQGAWDFMGDILCHQCYQKPAGSGEVQGSRDNPSRKARNHPERDFQDRVIALLQFKGYRVHAERHARTAKGWVTPIQGSPGFPDISAIKEQTYEDSNTRKRYQGFKALAWELKAKGGKPTPEQVEWLRLFELAGFDARVWTEDQEDDLIKLLEELT